MQVNQLVRGAGLLIVVGWVCMAVNFSQLDAKTQATSLSAQDLQQLSDLSIDGHKGVELLAEHDEIDQIKQRLERIERRVIIINNNIYSGAAGSNGKEISKSKKIVKAVQKLTLYVIQTVYMIVQLSCSIAQVYLLVTLCKILLTMRILQETSTFFDYVIKPLIFSYPWLVNFFSMTPV